LAAESEKTADDIAARLRRMEDREDLHDLVLRYCRAVDDKDWAALGELFANYAELGEAVGREAVVVALQSGREGYGRTVHTSHGQLLDFVDSDNATGMVTSHVELDVDGKTVMCFIRYYDRYVREAARWHFARRDLKFLYALPWAEMSVALTDHLPIRWPGTAPAPFDPF
jgi:hypothetical protein